MALPSEVRIEAPIEVSIDAAREGSNRHDLRWIRPPRQARTHQSLERVLDIAEAMLQEKDFDEIHIADLAKSAETSVAAFYRRFKDKDALLHALHERHCEEAYATADYALEQARWEGASIPDILHAIFPFLIDILHSNERLDRAILQRVMTDEAMRERQNHLSRYVVSGLTELLLDREDEIRHPAPADAIAFATVQSLAMLFYHHTVGTRDMSPIEFTDATLALELANSFLAYLGIEYA